MSDITRSFLVVLVTVCICALGCKSDAHRVNDTSTDDTSAARAFADSDWQIDLRQQLPFKRGRQIRCNSSHLCWTWDEQSAWIAENNRWRTLSLPPIDRVTQSRIKRIFFTSPQRGWFIRNLQLYETTDGGRSLNPITIPGLENPDDSVMDIFFVDENQGWIVGGGFEPLKKSDPLINTEITQGRIRTARLLHTRDGGRTWELVKIPRLIGAFNEIEFWNGKIGVASSRNEVLFTNDGGKSWQDMKKHFPTIDDGDHPESGTFLSGFFLPEQNAGWLLFSSLEFEALLTQDGGKSWQKTSWPIMAGHEDTSSFPPPPRFIFADAAQGLLFVGHTQGGELFKTSDGGKSWKRMTPPVNEVFFDVFFETNTGGFLVSNTAVYALSKK